MPLKDFVMAMTGRIDTREGLTSGEVEAMYDLMTRHYEGVARPRFEADLAEKQWVIRLMDGEGATLRGFSTQAILSTIVDGSPAHALFSGDTIIDSDHWGSSELALAWGRLAFQVIEAHPQAELYWYLITQGFRTYRFLPVFFQEFFPRPESPTPDRIRDVLDSLGASRYPDTFDREAGVIRASTQSYRLRPGLGDVTPARMNDPYIRFFVSRNPGHSRGDELCCLAPLTLSNFSAAARRLIASNRFAGRLGPC